MLESDIERLLVKRCSAAGLLCVKLSPDTGGRGIPDRLIVGPGGRVWWVELKRGGEGKVAPAQQVWREKLRRRGHDAIVLRTPGEVEALVQGIADAGEPV